MNQQISDDIQRVVNSIESRILTLQNEGGFWKGYLSSSALSTAVAAFSLWIYDRKIYRRYIEKGMIWLAENQNSDGGWGDTVKSSSNLSTTLLCWAALSVVEDDQNYEETIARCRKWLKRQLGTLEPSLISKSVLDHYQEDQTFSVPILTMCALSGRLGPNGWDFVPQLPFQLAALPDGLFKWLNLSVVSYAIPALIAMGLVKDTHSNNTLTRVNKVLRSKVLKVLAKKQPENGGFLEATPLTAFVLMSMVGAGESDLKVCIKAAGFIKESMRSDGSWPIDTNLATWVTTLTINSLSDSSMESMGSGSRAMVRSWLLNQQFRHVHPFTGSRPGGWGWTDLPGAVPDGDDTAGALLALKRLGSSDSHSLKAVSLGLEWLLDVQNRDGGIPTFCRGWGKLPFDCSCPDITAHVLRAFLCWRYEVNPRLRKRIDRSVNRIIDYLRVEQQDDGSWMPLWFGNENDKNHCNPVYGTSLVLYGLKSAHNRGVAQLDSMIDSAVDFLEKVQNSDGGWGGNLGIDSSIEETALAVRSLSFCNSSEVVEGGTSWLMSHLKNCGKAKPVSTPIGLYFASLWYFEEMYPLVFACSALNTVNQDLFN